MYHPNEESTLQGEAWTNRQEYEGYQQSQQHTEDYSLQFQNRYKIYQLNSKVNQANIRLQKMSLEFQNELKGEREYYLRVEQEKDELLQRYEELLEEFRRISIMQEADKNARVIASQNLRAARGELREIRERVGIAEGEPHEYLMELLASMMKKVLESEMTIKMLNEEGVKAKNKTDLEVKEVRAELERRVKQLNEQGERKVTLLESELQQIKKTLAVKEGTNREYIEKLDKLQRRQSQFYEQTKKLEQSYRTNMLKQQELSSLRVKQECWILTRQKVKQQKLKFDESIEQSRFQLELAQKRIQISENKTKQEQVRCLKLEEIIAEYRQKQRIAEEKYMQLQESNGELKKKLHGGEIYKEKYRQVQLKMKETEERAAQFSNMAQEYANQIQSLQDQLNIYAENKFHQQSTINDFLHQIEQKSKELMKLNLIISHQDEVIKQNKAQIQQSKKQLQFYAQNSNVQISATRMEQQQHLRVHTQQINEDIIKHYQSLLDSEDRNRSELQKQLQSANSNILQNRNQLSQLQRQYNEVKQEKELLCEENSRMIKWNAEMQRQYDRKIEEIRLRYQQIKVINTQTKNFPKKHMKIVNCFSFFQQAQGIRISSMKQIELRESRRQSEMNRSTSPRVIVDYPIRPSRQYPSTENSIHQRVKSPRNSTTLEEQIRLYRENNRNIRTRMNI